MMLERCQIHLNSWLKHQFWFQLMKLGQKVLGKKLFGLMMKQTFYGHFVAGEDQERIKPTIGRMQRWVDNEEKHAVSPIKKEFNQVLLSKSIFSFHPIWVSTYHIDTFLWIALEWNQSWTTPLRWMRRIFLFSSDFFFILSIFRSFAPIFDPVSTYCNLLQFRSEIDPGLLRWGGWVWGGRQEGGEEVLDIQEGEQDEAANANGNNLDVGFDREIMFYEDGRRILAKKQEVKWRIFRGF